MATRQKLVVPKYAWGRAPKTKEELWWSLYAFFGVKVPRTPVCSHHVTPFDALSEAYFAEVPVSIWLGSRGFGGKSYLLATLSNAEGAFLGAEISLLGGSGAQSLNVYNHGGELWLHPNAPRGLIQGDRTKFDTFFTNRGHIRSLMASQGSVRGPHPQRLRLDEIDEMDLEILEAAQGQPMRKRGIETQTVMSSTWQHPDGTVTEMRKRAERIGWPVREWCYHETSNPVDGWLSRDEVERKRREVPKSMWESEYDIQEPSFEGRSISTEMLDLAFGWSEEEYSGDRPLKFMEREAGAHYITGVDWAKVKDRTIVATFKVSEDPWVCVAWQQMRRMPWASMVGRAYNQWRYYGGRLIHDATGLGNVVDDLLRDMSDRSLHRYITPYVMGGGKERSALFMEYVAAIEQQDIVYPMIRYAYDEHRYCRDEDLYGRGHPPDSIVAGALAWRIRKKAIRLPTGVGGTLKASHWNG